MITPKMVMRAKNYVSKFGLASVVHAEMKNRGVLNPYNNKPYTLGFIKRILRGEQENCDIETTFLQIIIDKKKEREALQEKYKEEFKEELV
jgi:hypothetical protein